MKIMKFMNTEQFKKEFRVGRQMKDHSGKEYQSRIYEIISNDGKTAKANYIDDNLVWDVGIKTITIERGMMVKGFHDKIMVEEEIERNKLLKKFPISSHTKKYEKEGGDDWVDYKECLLYLAGNSSITVEVPSTTESYFVRRFVDIKGHDPEKYTIQENKYALQMRIYSKNENIMVKLSELVNVNTVRQHSDNQYNISDNDFIWELLSYGFNIGKDHNIEKIRKL